jgi:molybdopterin-containing oxidoreductase family membrane subunit
MKSIIYFGIDVFLYSWKGSLKYYAWLGFLGFFIMLAFWGNYEQLTKGMIVTGLNDQVTWGIYLANFVFLVGVAAAAVTVVFPAYIYKYKASKNIVIIGEIMAIAAVVACLLFVVNHMGRPDRAWHMAPSWLPIPYLHGIFNWPNSMLTWDVMALNGYLVLNIVCAFYYMYKKYVGEEVNKIFYIPLIYLACGWAISIHTVTAFLLNTMPARPMWAHSVLPIKFIITAFAAGPSLIIIALSVMKKTTKLEVDDRAMNLLSQIVTWCLGIALFLTLSEVVTEFYASTEHSYSLWYLITGMYGLTKLVPWFWFSLFLMVVSFLLLLIPPIRKNLTILPFICAMVFVGIWIEKGMGLLIPGFIPSPIGEFAEYTPSIVEIFNSLGNWAVGLMMFTMLSKVAIGIMYGDIKYRGDETPPVTKDVETPSFKPRHDTPWQEGSWGTENKD